MLLSTKINQTQSLGLGGNIIFITQISYIYSNYSTCFTYYIRGIFKTKTVEKSFTFSVRFSFFLMTYRYLFDNQIHIRILYTYSSVRTVQARKNLSCYLKL